MVDLPPPLGPTKAMHLFFSTVNVTFLRIFVSGLDEYVKSTLSKAREPSKVVSFSSSFFGTMPTPEGIFGLRSRSSNIRCEAPRAKKVESRCTVMTRIESGF